MEPDEAVAVVGMSCRFPQAPDPEAFWRLLSEGISAIGEVPAGRWTDDRPTPSGTDDRPTPSGADDRSTPSGTDDRSTPPAIRRGGFIDGVDRFDPAFFGISPREAAAMDPQQRLMLELAWEGLEDAGIVPATLRGATVGAFIGAGSDDYASLIRARGRSHHTLTGTQRGMIANRLSHVFGLSGPSVTVDAAQASSLVAVHMAVESVRRGESRLALAGGVNLNLSAETAADIAAFGALSPDGRCFTFDARANGYVRGEGGGLVVLKPLSDALADGDTVYCVIEGSAVNNDGGGASLTAPDPDGQRQVLRLAQRRAAISPEAVQYVELHGTGTALGDPAEAAALGAVFGRSGARPVQLGSVKTNIGHLEAAAGIAGLLKTALAIHHRQLPAGLNYRTPNPRIPMGELNLEMRLAPGEWPRPDNRLVAGVSSFGMGGTNCHVLLAEPLVGVPSHASAQHPEPESLPSPIPAPAPAPTSIPAPALVPVPLPLSGVSAAALRGQAMRLRSYLERSPHLTDLSFSLATTRTSFDHRAVLITGQATDAAHGLDALAEGGTVAGLVTGTARVAGKLAFAFAGQGSQRLGMGRELSAVFPVFAQALDEVCTALDAHLDRPLRDVIHGDDAELLNRTVYAQAGLFAVEVALFRLLEDFGLVPDLLIGHSLGEVSAAHVAGVLSLADAAAFVAARGRLMQAVTEPGAMVSLEATEDEVTRTLMAGGASDDDARVCVAAVNGPTATVISGDERAVLDLAVEWTRRGRRTKRLRTSHAFHSPHLDPVLDELRHIAESLTYRAPRIPLVSNVTGRRATAEELCSPEYWVRHVRRTVRFLDGVRCLEDEGVTTIVELGPDKALTTLARDCLTGPGTLVGTLRRDRPEPPALVTALAELYVSGVEVAWSPLVSGGRRIPLPTYAFQRQRYWFSAPSPETPSPETPGPETPGPESGTTPGHGVTSGSERTDTGLSGGEARDTGTRDTGLSGGGMLGMVRAHAAVVLGYESATAIGAEHTFKQLGFDSITAVELCERLGAATALPLPGTLLFDYPTPAALAEHLHRRLHGRTDERAVPATVPTPDGGDPVVIVGMGCRFPGRAHSPEDLWRIVADGEDAISGFPSDRGWDLDGLYHPDPDRPGTSYARDGGFLYDAAEFDAGFFGISPREAEAMDPQQRLLLETSWEALERAGIPAEHIKGSSTGVFIGASSVGYAADAGSAAEGYQLTGTAASVASGRVSYALGLEGPAVTVDTACSSSLVALHLAVQSLRAGECSLALAGGVTVMATPAMFVEFSRQRGLATDGRCKAFAAAADGTGWAEGVGVLVVERLSDAERLGHRVLAVVRGSAVNQDGASNGLTAPNGPSQQRVIRQALASAGLVASDVDAVEAHGTGTTLGDPIEAQALLATYGQDRDTNRPLWLGSLKSNIGHAQAAAGVAGVIKMVMAMRHGVLPRTLHVDEPSPHVDWSGGRVELLTATTPWPTNGGLRRAGVSSFGVSGTNAHVILEQAPEIAQPTGPIEEGDREAAAVAWVLSGQGEAGLRAQAERLRAFMAADPRPTPAEVGWSLASTRTTLSHRAVVVGAGHDELLRGVNAVANGTPAPGVVRGTGSSGDVVFVFPGQGSQWAGMALELLEHSPVFAERMRECADELAPFVEWSLFDVLGDEVALGRVDVVQPVLWAVMVSLAELWRSFGVVPSVVVGHSQGEIAAACVAGGLSLEDGARVVALRSRALLALSGRGGMVSVPVAADRLRGRAGLSVAAVNGPASTVVSGSVEVLDGVLAEFPEAKRIPVDYASHSVQVEGIREGLAEALAPVRPCAGEVPFYSTVTGRLMDTIELDAEYWYRNLRETVEFQSTVEALIDQGHTVFVEASPHPVLTLGIQDTADATDTDIVVTGSLRRDDGTVQRFLTSLSELHVRGVRIDWGPLFAGVSPVELPTYAFQRERFWLGADIAESAVDTWRYQISWKPLPDMDTPALSGTWLAVVPEGDEWAMAGARALVESGTASVRTLQVSRDADRRTLAGLLTDAAGSEDIAGVVSFLAADEVPHPAHPALSRGMAHTVELLCSLTTAAVEAPLWCVTRAAVTALPADQAPSPAQAAVWGFGRVAGLERPERWGGLIDLPVHCDAHVLRRFVAVLAQAAGEDQVAVRPSAALGRRLEPAPRTGPAGTWRPHGTVLITGGTGVLGAHVARWLAQSGAEHLVLLSRRGPQAPGAAVLDDELTALGVRVTVTACDVTDRAALAGVLASVPDLTAVVHLAGTVRFGNSIDADLDEYAGVFDAKVTGALHLDALLDHSSLEAFVLFSSAAAVWGGVGQAGYAAANALLDAVAQRRRARGLPATSIGWGTWGGSLAPEDEERLSRIGLRPMRPEVAVTELRHVVGSAEPCPAIADVDWETFGPAFTAGRPSPLLSELPQLRNTSGSMAVAGDHAALRRRLTGVSAVDQARTLVDLVREHAAELLGHRGPAAIDPTVPFRQLGFDSLTAVELRTRLNAATGLRLPATLLFDHPSCRAVADLLRSELLGDRSDSLAASSATEAVPAGVVASDEPIAIVAMSCRFPGGIETPEDLWRVVSEGRDVLSDFPDDRGWDVDALYDPDPDRPGTSYVRTGGFLHDAAEFDPELFGISPREALAMDPQQRLLLESAWQVLERARMAPTSLRSSRTGVFIGGWGQGYPSASDEGYALTGAATSVMSGRIAYALGLEGPALTVDTACSSSLVALHLASEALRRGECSLALAGGVTVMATPSTFVEFSRQRGLAPDGRCKPFAGAADGTGWGEGVGMLLLERLSDAERLGHRVLAVMRGSAVNQDGVSNGLTAPNGPSQQRVIRQALASAGLVASDVDAVEAHGTGTTLGDPIEAQALLATYGQGRDADQPLWLGSLKSNISHTQAAAGVAGVIKMVMAMRHGVLPQTLHVDEPTPHVDWSAGAVRLLTERTPWPETDRPRRAGVSAFGVSGTNAHVIVEQAPEAESIEPPRTDPVTVPWVLSGASEAGLRAQVEGLRAFADDNPALDPVDVGWSLASTRALLPYRTVVVGTGLDELRRGLDAAEVVGAAEPDRGAVLVFPGQGSQWVGMALELVGSSPVFAGRLGECADALAPFVEWSLWDVLGDEVALGRVDVVQPVLWAVMVSLAELWCSFGVVPSVVVGHSQGEIAAACVAGGLSLEDGARVVALRSRALLALSGRGGMVSVPVAADRLRGRVGLSVAAVNGPVSTVVSGSVEVLDGVLAEFPEAKRIPVDYASHSSQVEEVREGLAEALAPVRPRAGEVPFFSTVTGRLMDTVGLDAEYWYRNLRETVEFQSAIEGLLELGHTVFVEASPHPVLTVGIQDTADATDTDVLVTGSLRRDGGDLASFLTALARLHVRGVAVEWREAFSGLDAHVVDLPTYAFQRRRFWAASLRQTPGAAEFDHPLLGAVVPLPDSGGGLLTGVLTLAGQPWLAEHSVAGVVLFPGTGFVELVLQAGLRWGCGVVEELTLEGPLVVPERGEVEVQVSVGGVDGAGCRSVSVFSCRGGEWVRHAVGVLGVGEGVVPGGEVWPPVGAEWVGVEGVYGVLAERGYAYGPVFQGLRDAWRRGDEVFVEVEVPAEARADAARCAIHPALLDAGLHGVGLGGLISDDGRAYLPFSWSGVRLHAVGASAVRMTLTPAGPDAVSLRVTDEAGEAVLTVDSLVLRPVTEGQLAEAEIGNRDVLHRVEWVDAGACSVGSFVEWGEVAAGGAVPDCVVLAGVDVAGVLEVLRAWVVEERFEGSRLVVVTRGAVSVSGEGAEDVGGGAVWGLVRSAQSEHPGRFVLVDADVDMDVVPDVVGLGEWQVAVRGGRVWVPRLVDAGVSVGGGVVRGELGSGVALVTGGTGLLGGLVARHLVSAYGVGELVLVSRRGPDAPGVRALVGELEGLGARVRVVACDVADRGAVAELVGSIEGLRVVVHAAGAVDDGVIGSLDAGRLRGVMGAKAWGAWHLHELTRELDLSAFVLFSSAAGVLGNAGQGGYAAANGFLDALAVHRRGRGLPAVSIAWGFWEERSELTADLAEVQLSRISRSVGASISSAQGLDLFDAALAADEPMVLATPLNLPALRDQAAAGTLPSILSGLVTAPVRRAADTGRTPAGLRHQLAGVTEAERQHQVMRLVQEHVAGVLGHASVESVDTSRTFQEIGFDSLTAVELRNRISAATGIRLPATAVFDHPTPRLLAERVLAEVGGSLPTAAPIAPVSAVDDEPIVIVGMSCRFPGGVESPEDLWHLVHSATDAVSGLPTDRGWDLATLSGAQGGVGASYARDGGFLYDAAAFDAGFFGISPREATAMDPQQRLLLEAAWEVFERAGIAPDTLKGSRTGVFTGVMYHDYGSWLTDVPEDVEGYLGTGIAGSVASGRLAYTFGLEGPALTVDTACSSSLVALHLATESLRRGECSLALAGGVTVLATPQVFVEFTRQGGLASDGRCKPFAAGADGTGWSEGVGLLLLERLSDAERLGHRVLAVVRGSAVNQDGASNGLTAPNGPSQQRVIRQALANAGLAARDVDAVEAHGTGTTLGDPIEAQALLATYGQGRDVGRPLWLGSVKSNIGHTQAAAGVAGVIKMVMAMRHGVLPRSLHIDEPTPHVDWSTGAVELLEEHTGWPEAGRPRRAGVSSFGASGTNAHVILEQATDMADEPEQGPERNELPAIPWVLSAGDEAGLRAQVVRLRAFADRNPDLDPADVGWSLATGRAGLSHRAVVVGADREELLGALAGAPVVGVPVAGGLGVLFAGQGSQRLGMGRGLYEAYPVFAAVWDEVCGELDRYLDRPVGEVVWGDDAGLIGETAYTQAGLFALEVALFALVSSWGVKPDYLLGHSIGELAAAYVAGVWSLEDAARVVAARGRLMQALPSGGAMVAVAASEDEVRPLLTDGVAVAAVNGPEAVVVSGDEDAVHAIEETFAMGGARTRRLRVSHAFHSARMDGMLAEFGEVLNGVEFRAPSVPVVSNVSGVVAGEELCSPEYWVRHVRETVRFADGLDTLRGLGVGSFLELGPDGTLTALADGDGLPVLRRDRPEPLTVMAALGGLHVRGVQIDWDAVFPGARRVDLPTYAFQRERFWLESSPERSATSAVDAAFWDAVERGDLGSFGIDAEQPLSAALPALSSWRRAWQEQSVIDAWRYRLGWTAIPAVPGEVVLTGTWLVVVEPGADGTDVAAALRSAGASVEVVTGVTSAELGAGPVAGVVSLLSVEATVSLLQALVAAEVDGPLWCVTRGAVSALDGDLVDPDQAGIWGLGRVIGLEYPDRWGGLIDLPAELDDRAGRALVGILAGDAGEDQVAIRAAGAWGARLMRAVTPMGGVGEVAARWCGRGTALVTGGTGALGRQVARWLVDRGVGRVVLTSRRGVEAAGAGELVAELGSRVRVVACDVGDREALAAVLATVPDVRIIVHAAGVLDDGVLESLSPERVRAVMRAKAEGARHLHELTRDTDLDAFVLFSSAAGTVGNAGQGSYAAANAVLDGLAWRRRAEGLVATSVAWGAWADSGMGAGHARAMAPRLALAALQRALDDDETALMIADIDWEHFGSRFTAVRPSPLLSELLPRFSAPMEPVEALATRLRGMSRIERDRAVLELVRAQVAAVLGHAKPASVDPSRTFQEVGFDSLTAVELRNRLATATGVPFPGSVIFDYPTPAALADHVRARFVPDKDEDEGGAASVLDELTRLEAVLSDLSPSDVAGAEVAAKIKSLLSHWGAATNSDIDMDSATDEEMFDLLGKEFGIS